MSDENEIDLEAIDRIPIKCLDAMADVLKTIQAAVDSVEDEEQLLEEIEKLQEASVDGQVIFVIRLLLKYLDEDRRTEALKGFK